MTPQVTVDRDYVIIDGHKIPRSALCSPSQWLEFWAKVDGGHQAAVDETNHPN